MTAEQHPLHKPIVAALRKVKDPEIPVNLYDLGLIYNLAIADDGNVDVQMTLTTPNCPVAESLPGQVERAVRGVAGVSDVNVELVWEPAWTKDRISETGQMELGMLGIELGASPGPQRVSVDSLFSKKPR
jgi:FeS assembly SUF system protein